MSLPRHRPSASASFALLPVAAALALISHSAWAQLPPPIVSAGGQIPSINTEQAIPIYPHVRLNGTHIADAMGFYAKGDTVYANASTLRGIGISLEDHECHASEVDRAVAGLPPGYFAIKSCPALVSSSFIARQQLLGLQAPLSRLDLPTTELAVRPDSEAPELTRPGYSMVLNYDLSASGSSDTSTRRGAYTQWRLGTPLGYLESNHVQSLQDGKTSHQRLDTFWRSVWPEQGVSLTVGDTFTSQLGGSNGSRLGGVQISSSFNTRPWYQKLPQTLLHNSTEMPGVVDLYINGIKQYSQDVAAGPYELTLPPTVSRSGNAQIITRDALGRQTVVEVPLYDSTELLAPGLAEWSLEAGKLRRSNEGSGSYDKDLAYSGNIRQGVSDNLTLQVHSEGKKGYRQAGYGFRAAAAFPSRFGGQASYSKLHGKTGHQYRLFAQQQGSRWTLSAGFSKDSPYFASFGHSLSDKPFDSQPKQRRQAYLNGSLSLNDWGYLSLGRVWSRSGNDEDDIWSLGWNRQISPRVHLVASANYNQKDSRQRNASIGVNVQLDGNIQSDNYYTHNNGLDGISTQLRRNVSQIGDWGWNLGYQDDHRHQDQSLTAGVQHINQFGEGSVQARQRPHGQNSWQADWRGGLSMMAGKAAASRTVYDSFAVVETSGVADVPVMVNNQIVGYTDKNGKVLVPGLSAYVGNRIQIDSNKLPPNQRVENNIRSVVPYEKAGVTASFDIHSFHAWTARLQNAQGQDLPMGASLIDAAGQAFTVVGFDGQVYAETAAKTAQKGQHNYTVRYINEANGQTQECRFGLNLAGNKANEFVEDFGAVTCR